VSQRAARLGEGMGVVCLRLKARLRRLWKDKCLTQDQVRILIQLLETQAGTVVTRQDEIVRD
jgi:DNA-binding winged helix-turn-helix (wHTH) protein